MNLGLHFRAAQAHDLAAGRFSYWLRQARALWLAHPVFFLLVAAVTVLLRRTLDALGMDVFILVSYLTDAWIFAWLVTGFSRAGPGSALGVVKAGWQGMRGRWFAIAKTVIWGLPAALASFLIFLLVPEGVQALVVLQGNVMLATGLLFAALLVGGFISMLLGLLPVLAAIQVARDPQATVMSSGLWAYRGLRAGIRPLMVMFILFLFAAVTCNAAITWGVGHLPVDVFRWWTVDDILEVLALAPVTVFVMINGFLALLPGMTGDLLKSADTDLSDEIFSEAEKVAHGDAFGIRVLEVFGQSLRLIAMLSVVFLVIYAALAGYDEAGDWLVFALVAYWWGGSFRKSARGWREGGSWWVRYRFLITPVWLGLAIMGLAALGEEPVDSPQAPES